MAASTSGSPGVGVAVTTITTGVSVGAGVDVAINWLRISGVHAVSIRVNRKMESG
jgi:pantoate kinase